MDGDTVLVDQGVYYENLILQKSITLTSYAIYDDLSNWTGFAGEYYINNDNIASTIINGSNDTNGEDFESTILINSPDDECIQPLIFGFTITGGDGTTATFQDSEGNDIEETRGGGFLSYNALPTLNYNFIKDNDDDIDSGGGGEESNGDQIRNTLHGYTFGRPRCEGNLDLSFNFYRDNDALYGNTLSTHGFEGSIDMSSSIFDVYNCPDEEVTPVWVDVEEDVEVDFQYSAGDLCSITEDVWVSPDGDDYLNTGTSPDNAFLTIKTALQLIAPDSLNAITINLTEGTFSPSTTGENFSIIMIANVNLIGQGEEVTIIDAEQTGGVITMEECENNTISDLTITGGHTDDYGGGMYVTNSNPTLTNVTISENTAGYDECDVCGSGGGMYVINSNPTLTNVTINENTAGWNGGGMRLASSHPALTNVTISGNTANGGYGGGMYLGDSHPALTNVTISGNTALENNIDQYSYGGGMCLQVSNPTLTNSIIWDNNPQSIYIFSGIPLITYSDIEVDEEDGYCIGNNEFCNDANQSECLNMVDFGLCNEWLPYMEGEGNINSTPLFTDPENGDYTLQEGSPCIDTGTIMEDIEYCGDAPDMGAYEYITEDCVECGVDLADVNGDSEINILDLVQIANLILETSTPAYECAADYNQDGEVNILDLVQIANYILDN